MCYFDRDSVMLEDACIKHKCWRALLSGLQ